MQYTIQSDTQIITFFTSIVWGIGIKKRNPKYTMYRWICMNVSPISAQTSSMAGPVLEILNSSSGGLVYSAGSYLTIEVRIFENRYFT